MECEECGNIMNPFMDDKHWELGWRCPFCGWSVVTTYVPEIYADATVYSLYITNRSEINVDKIKLLSEIAKVNFLTSRQMLEGKEVCVLKAKAPEMKERIDKLQKLEIDFMVRPMFRY